MNIGFVGLGKVGTYIASSLLREGFNVTVYNRTLTKAKQFAKKFHSEYAKSIQDLCKNKKIIILCVDTEQAVETLTNQIKHYLAPNTSIIDHSTINYEISKKIHKSLKKQKISFLDAPITGGQQGAQSSIGGIMVGGDKETFAKTKKIIQSYTTTLEYMGASGQGQLTKIANQICSFNIKQGLLEALDFANKYKIPRKKLVEILLSGSAFSLQLTKNLQSINQKKYEKERHYARKEIGIAMKNAKSKKLRLHCTEQLAKLIRT